MNLKGMIINSLRYSSSNWVKLITLGLVIFLADMSNESTLGVVGELKYVVIIFATLLGIYQLGFLFRIIEETTHGSDVLPRFDNIWNTFLHGIKETLVTLIYFIIPFIMILMGVAIIDDLTGSKPQEISMVLIILGILMMSITYLVYQATELNMADHHGTIKSAFDLKRIVRKVRAIGLKNLFFIYLLTVVFAALVEITISDTKTIPYVGDYISSFIVAPFLLIFIARTLGLINRTVEY